MTQANVTAQLVRSYETYETFRELPKEKRQQYFRGIVHHF